MKHTRRDTQNSRSTHNHAGTRTQARTHTPTHTETQGHTHTHRHTDTHTHASGEVQLLVCFHCQAEDVLSSTVIPIPRVRDFFAGFPCTDVSSLNAKRDENRSVILQGGKRTGKVFKDITQFIARGASAVGEDAIELTYHCYPTPRLTSPPPCVYGLLHQHITLTRCIAKYVCCSLCSSW